jgi:aminoglycoside phosphotransferase (APT) family kinase protein
VASDPEQSLPGGFVNAVVRIGDTVRRSPGERASYVHELLDHLAAAGWTGAPRYAGIDEDGREVLTFIEGHVAWEPTQPADVTSDASLRSVARMVREFHDLTAGTPLAGDAEAVCHNDLSPRNTVYRDLGEGVRPIAFIDWDIAAPGARIHDVAHMCWQYVGLGPDGHTAEEAGRRMAVVCDGYDLADRSDLVDTVLWWQDRCWRGIEDKATAGDPAMARLRDLGAPPGIRAAYDWVRRHRRTLQAAVNPGRSSG